MGGTAGQRFVPATRAGEAAREAGFVFMSIIVIHYNLRIWLVFFCVEVCRDRVDFTLIKRTHHIGHAR
jgi:hypothetical protein